MVALALAAALASPASVPAVDPSLLVVPQYWYWQVEEWEASCYRRGCHYDFNVTVPDVVVSGDIKIPRGKAYCFGDEQGYENSFTVPSTFTPCWTLEGNNTFAAKFSKRERGSSPKEIIISYLYKPEENGSGYNYTASHETVYNQAAPAINFSATASSVHLEEKTE